VYILSIPLKDEKKAFDNDNSSDGWEEEFSEARLFLLLI
jgi:hypothetical protein